MGEDLEAWVRAHTDDGVLNIEPSHDGELFAVVQIMGSTLYFQQPTRSALVAEIAAYRHLPSRRTQG